MKGLILKDWYLAKTYGRMMLLVSVVFLIIYSIGGENMFFLLYPCVLFSALPINLLSYDEKDQWCEYAQTLPVSREQYVTGKYLVGLCSVAAVLLPTAAVLSYRKLYLAASTEAFFSLLASAVTLGLLVPSFVLPCVFRFGIEKGRIAYFTVLGFFSAAAIVFMTNDSRGLRQVVSGGAGGSAALPCLVAAALYAVSWRLSVAWYRKRNIR